MRLINTKGSKFLMHYYRFGAMIATSTIVMFILMYLNTYALDHVFWSETRVYMALLMGAVMAIVMLSFMLGLYKNRKINIAIYAGACGIALVSLFLVRSQATIKDESWMSAMIPHHSIAIMTSERAHIHDLRVRELADGIISAQRKEIKEMKWLLNDIDANGIADKQSEADQRPVPEFDGSPTAQRTDATADGTPE